MSGGQLSGTHGWDLTLQRGLLLVSLVLGLCAFPCHAAQPRPSPVDISRNITSILNKLVNPSNYDKRLRPNYGGDPVDIGITIHVSSISAVSEVAMDYTLDIYLRQTWTDKRLAFRSYEHVTDLTIGIDYLKEIWAPDTFFPNEKNSYFHFATTHNSFLRISKDGAVYTSQRITVTATCPMNLILFPLDSQECTLEIESYHRNSPIDINYTPLTDPTKNAFLDGYSTREIRYLWERGKASVSWDQSLTLPQFEIVGKHIKQSEVGLSTGNYSRMRLTFVFARSLGFYIIQVYLPSVLIVIISWVSFWLSRDATPARVALGVTTVLTMTTLMSTTNSTMPKVSYVKSIDIYLGTCFMMVFASLLEYAAVGYLSKRQKLRAAKLQGLGNAIRSLVNPGGTGATGQSSTPTTIGHQLSNNLKPPLSPNDRNRPHHQHNQSPHQRVSNHPSPTASTPLLVESHRNYTEETEPSGTGANMGLKMTFTMFSHRREEPFSPSGIDKYSRIFFPLTFACFNALYWTIYFHLRMEQSDGYSEDDIMYKWGKKAKEAVSIDPNVRLPQFSVSHLFVGVRTFQLSTGNYSRISLRFVFSRNLGFYLIQIYLPSNLIVIISWVSFWLSREASPARVALGVTTVLTMTTLMTTTNAGMPKVAYVKTVDVYLGTSFFMVFASLLEYAAVVYLNKMLRRRKERQVQSSSNSSGPKSNSSSGYRRLPPPTPASQPAPGSLGQRLYIPGMPADQDEILVPRYRGPTAQSPLVRGLVDHSVECDCDLGATPRFLRLPTAQPVKKRIRGLTPSAIDKYSRMIFPLVFLIFNALYWGINMHLRVERMKALQEERDGYVKVK